MFGKGRLSMHKKRKAARFVVHGSQVCDVLEEEGGQDCNAGKEEGGQVFNTTGKDVGQVCDV